MQYPRSPSGVEADIHSELRYLTSDLYILDRAVNFMYLLSNIQFTKEKLNALYQLGVKYKWYGPEAPLLIRWIFYILRPTYVGKLRDRWISDSIKQFNREFRNLQRASSIPSCYWDNAILNVFEEYLLSNRAFTLEQCINLYNSENSKVNNYWQLTEKDFGI